MNTLKNLLAFTALVKRFNRFIRPGRKGTMLAGSYQAKRENQYTNEILRKNFNTDKTKEDFYEKPPVHAD